MTTFNKKQHSKSYMKDYYNKHKDILKKRNKIWYENHRDACLTFRRKYYVEHKEEIAHRKKHNYLITTDNNGKRLCLKVKKREYNGKCEICNKNIKKISNSQWHHWDDKYPEKGMWSCINCHHIVEGYEKGIVNKYIKLKDRIEAGECNNYFQS